MNILNFGSQFRCIFKALSNIQDGGFWKNSEWLLGFDYFAKSSILDSWHDSEFASKASIDLWKKLHLRSQMQGFAFLFVAINYFRESIGYLLIKFD